MSGEPILSMTEGGAKRIWDYQASQRIPGAFRAISVNALLRTPATISLHEWADLDLSKEPSAYAGRFPKYAAISHAWKVSDAVLEIATRVNRPLRIDITRDKPAEHEI